MQGYRRHSVLRRVLRGGRQKTCSPAHGGEASGGRDTGQGRDGAAQQRDQGAAEQRLRAESPLRPGRPYRLPTGDRRFFFV